MNILQPLTDLELRVFKRLVITFRDKPTVGRNYSRVCNSLAQMCEIEQHRRAGVLAELEKESWPVEVTWRVADSWNLTPPELEGED